MNTALSYAGICASKQYHLPECGSEGVRGLGARARARWEQKESRREGQSRTIRGPSGWGQPGCSYSPSGNPHSPGPDCGSGSRSAELTRDAEGGWEKEVKNGTPPGSQLALLPKDPSLAFLSSPKPLLRLTHQGAV